MPKLRINPRVPKKCFCNPIPLSYTEIPVLLKKRRPSNEPLFFKQRAGPWFPNLRLLHAYPFLLPIQIVDKGAIKFILSGAHIMCPGLTSKGAFLNMDTAQGSAVQVCRKYNRKKFAKIFFFRQTLGRYDAVF